MVRVTAVDVGRSSVEPIGWEPDDVAYAAVVADVPLPPAEVQLDPWIAPEPGDPRPGADRHRRRRRARRGRRGVASAGARRHAVAVRPGGRALDAARRVPCACASPSPRRASSRSGGPTAAWSPARSPVSASHEGAARLVVSPSRARRPVGAGQVARRPPVARRRRRDPRRLRGDGGGDPPTVRSPAAGVRRRLPARVPTAVADGSWRPPRVFVELRNETEDDLYVAVLDLTDRFRCHAVLPTELLGRGRLVRPVVGRPDPGIPAGWAPGRPGGGGAGLAQGRRQRRRLRRHLVRPRRARRAVGARSVDPRGAAQHPRADRRHGPTAATSAGGPGAARGPLGRDDHHHRDPRPHLISASAASSRGGGRRRGGWRCGP